MDFIARAGSIVQYGHRITGIVMVVCIIEAFFLMRVVAENRRLQLVYDGIRKQMNIYVVPGSSGGIYAPSKGEFLRAEFVKYVAQNLNTYTPVNLPFQYTEIKTFFTPEMIVVADQYYSDLIAKAQADGRSSLFIPGNRVFTEEIPDPNNPRKRVVQATIIGTVRTILGGSEIEAAPVKITMHLRAVPISGSNPFGQTLSFYNEEEATRDDLKKVGL